MAGNLSRRLRPGVLRNPVFLVCLFTYLIHTGLVKLGYTIPLLQHYLGDLLCLPVVLTVTLFLQRRFFYRTGVYVLSVYQVGLAVAYFSIAFEVVFPQFMERYTTDLLDVLAYGMGGIIFHRFINKPGN